jgi:hypothetical protein
MSAVNDAKAGDLVVVKNVQPSGCYPLRDGLTPGYVVRLVEFDHGYWDVLKPDGTSTTIYMMNIDRIVK